MIFFLILLLILLLAATYPFIKEKSVVSSLPSLKNHCHNLLPLQSPLHASVGMIVQFYSTLSDFVLIYV